MHTSSRREFLGRCSASLAALILPAPAWSLVARDEHPTPRVGITGAKVLTKEQLASTPQLIPLFDAVREIPQIVDGIHCYCGCAEAPAFYSLLSCYEGGAMALKCPMCQETGRIVTRLHKEGKTLDEIRRAVDEEFA